MKLYKIVSIAILCLACIISGCGSPEKDLSFQDIPHYPASTPGQSMQSPDIGGTAGGEILQLSTTDPFETVVEFYTDELNVYHPEILSHTSELGRQTAITVKQEKSVITVSIQEFIEKARVMITHMAVST